MPEITKSSAKLHLFIVTHKYTDLYFIFSFNNQPQVGKPTWGYDYTTVFRRLPPTSSAIHRIAHPHRPPSSSYCASTSSAITNRRLPHPSSAITHLIAPTAQYTAIGEKTAEERFNMLARGWLAYPVTPTHHPSTAEERLYKRHPIGLPRPVTPCAIRRERSLRFPEAPLFALINYCFLTAELSVPCRRQQPHRHPCQGEPRQCRGMPIVQLRCRLQTSCRPQRGLRRWLQQP